MAASTAERLGAAGLVRTAWQTALSRGPGYEDLPAGRAVESGGYFVDYSAKTTLPEPTADGVPIRLIQWALGWNECSPSGAGRTEVIFLDASSRLLAVGDRAGDALLFWYEVPVPKYGLDGRWLSAHAQGQAASTFTRAYLRTGSDMWAEAAAACVVPLISPEYGLITPSGDGPVLEEAPSSPPSQILNGWITGLWGLLDVGETLGHSAAAQAFADGVECLRRRTALYDVGWWTRYSLYPHRVLDLAKPVYHRFHATQIEVIARLTGDADLAATAKRWRDYDSVGHRGRALAQKALFVATRANTPQSLSAQTTPGASLR
jgi:heparosan-N-sulfate-glucuronate 5-epimerase